MRAEQFRSSFKERLRRCVVIGASTCLIGGGAVGVAIGSSVGRASADVQGPINFDSYALGTVNAQNGWSSLGAAGSGCATYDHAIADNSTLPGAPPSFGTKSLRISDAVTSGCFSDQTFSPKTVDDAGEPGADAGTRVVTAATNMTTAVNSGDANFTLADVGRTVTGTCVAAATTIASRTSATVVVLNQAAITTDPACALTIEAPSLTPDSNFSSQFSFSSVTPATEEPGLHMSVAPDRGDGARMSYVRIEDSPTGWNLFFDDYQDVAPLGSGGNLDDGCGTGDDFVETQIASGLTRAVPHKLRFDMQFVPGPHNDVVNVSLDGAVVATGTSWEDYYRYCAESGGGTGGPLANQTRVVKSLLFRTSGTADPANAGEGFLIDGVQVAAGDPCTTTCYVNSATGNDLATGQSGDPLRTIQEGVNQVSAGGTVQVAAGTYVENVTVPKGVHITGAGITTVVEPAVSNPDCGGGGGSSLCPGGSNVFLVQADNVTIDHLKVDGDNPGLSGTPVGGADVDARNGIIVDFNAGVFNNLSVHDVTVDNVFLRGIYAGSGGSFNFTNNVVDNVQGDPNGSVAIFDFGGGGIVSGNVVSHALDAISANWSTGTQFTGNTVTTSGSGVHTDNNGGFGGTSTGDVINGNNVSACTAGGFGVFAFVPYVAPTISNNTVTGCDTGLAAYASCNLAGVNNCPAAVVPTVTFTHNTVTDSLAGDGLLVSTTSFGYGDGQVKASADHNTISGPGKAVHIQETGVATASATVTRNSITGLVNDGSTTVDGRCNWWGQATGPASGQVFGPATVAPYLLTSNLSGGCLPIASLPTSALTTVEGNSGTHPVTMNVTLNGPSAATTSVLWHTANGTAGATDYMGASGTLSFAPGQTTKPITVMVKGDTLLEGNEYFFVDIQALSGVTLGVAQARVVILNDEKPTVVISGPSSVTEGTNNRYQVNLSEPYYLPLTITLTTLNGTAHAGTDFGAVTATATFPAGVTKQPLPLFPFIHTNLDGITEGAESFILKFTSPSIAGGSATFTVTIKANTT